MKNVNWIAARVALNWVDNGPTSNVHTYCGLAIAIMHSSPNSICTQRVLPRIITGPWTVVLMRDIPRYTFTYTVTGP